MRLSWSHDLGLEFDRLTQVDSGYFFYLIFMRLSQSHDSGHGFGWLTQVKFF
jgi:hypothetical protein